MKDKVIRKLSDKCQHCKHVDECNEKRMMLCKVRESMEKEILFIAPITAPRLSLVIQPVLRDTSIKAQRTEQKKEQIKKEIYKSLYVCEHKQIVMR